MKILTMLIIMIFLLTSISFSEMQPQNSIQKINLSEMAIEKYKQEEKNVGLGILGWWLGWVLVPSLGHALVGDWLRGVPFLVSYSIGYSLARRSGVPFIESYTGLNIMMISKAWEYVDVVSYVNESNWQLKRKYGLDVSIRNNLPVLQYTLKF